jgi:hypothetical protein
LFYIRKDALNETIAKTLKDFFNPGDIDEVVSDANNQL